MSVETTTGTATPAAAPAGAKPRAGSGWLLAVCCVAQFMVILDLSIVNVALPSIQSSLEFSSPELQWVVDAYAITFAGFLMLGGRAADPGLADRRPRDPRGRGRADGRLLAGDHHRVVPARAEAASRDRHLGG